MEFYVVLDGEGGVKEVKQVPGKQVQAFQGSGSVPSANQDA